MDQKHLHNLTDDTIQYLHFYIEYMYLNIIFQYLKTKSILVTEKMNYSYYLPKNQHYKS